MFPSDLDFESLWMKENYSVVEVEILLSSTRFVISTICYLRWLPRVFTNIERELQKETSQIYV